DDTNHAQLGDPVKAAAAMITVATSADPPSRLQLGADCVSRVESKLATVARELEQWRALALSTAHADAREPESAGAPRLPSPPLRAPSRSASAGITPLPPAAR